MTPQQLTKYIPCSDANAARFAEPLTTCVERFSINTPVRQAAFLAQIAHESGSLRYVRELASGEAYEGRRDLGNTNVGDGVRYKGRGLIQTTGRGNYIELQPKLKLFGYTDVPDFVSFPEKLEEPLWAAASAGYFWYSRGLNELADQGDFLRISIKINGRGKDGLPNHWKERQDLWTRVKGAMNA